MPTTQPTTYTPCLQKGKAPRMALQVKAPKKKKNKKHQSHGDMKKVKRLLVDAFNEEGVEKK